MKTQRASKKTDVKDVTKTLKLPLLDLNAVKAEEFSRLGVLNTALANRILALPLEQRRSLTSRDFSDQELGSAWVNQTIRNVHASRRAKTFRSLPLETNNRNGGLHKVGNTWSTWHRFLQPDSGDAKPRSP
jgi:hypothetical protein